MEPVAARELMARSFQTRPHVICYQHTTLPHSQRAAACKWCTAEILAALAAAAEQIEWLQHWRDDALDVLARQDAALGLISGWEARRHPHGVGADVVRGDIDGATETLVGDIHQEKADHLAEWLAGVDEVADGLVPLIDLEGEDRGSRQTDP
jgi:hypothetical protein